MTYLTILKTIPNFKLWTPYFLLATLLSYCNLQYYESVFFINSDLLGKLINSAALGIVVLTCIFFLSFFEYKPAKKKKKSKQKKAEYSPNINFGGVIGNLILIIILFNPIFFK